MKVPEEQNFLDIDYCLRINCMLEFSILSYSNVISEHQPLGSDQMRVDVNLGGLEARASQCDEVGITSGANSHRPRRLAARVYQVLRLIRH